MTDKPEKTDVQAEAEKKDPEVNLAPGERTPANVAQRDESGHASDDNSQAPDTDGVKGGDINAGENKGGPDAIGGGDVIASSNSAGARSQVGPENGLTQDDVLDQERTDDALDIGLVDGQDKVAVQARIADEIGNLAADQSQDKTFRTATAEVAYAPPGSKNASNMGVQEDASGHFESIAHTRSASSNSRV